MTSSGWTVWMLLGAMVQSAFAEVPFATNKETALLLSGRTSKNKDIIIRINGDPHVWIDHVHHNLEISMSSITATNRQTTKYRALGSHHGRGLLFWSNPAEMDIEFSANIIGGQTPIVDVHTATSAQVTGMAVDFVYDNVYWTDSAQKHIMMSSLRTYAVGQGGSPYPRVVVDRGLQKPSGIAVHPYKSQLFWSDVGRFTIETSDLAGGDRRPLPLRGSSPRPIALTVSIGLGRLYWLDAESRQLWAMDLDGNNAKNIFFFHQSADVQLAGVAAYGPWVFTTGNNTQRGPALYAIDTNDPHNNLMLPIKPKFRSDGVVREFFDACMFADEEQPRPLAYVGRNYTMCSHPGLEPCPHLCVGNEETRYRKCLCADGFHAEGCESELELGSLTTTRPAVPHREGSQEAQNAGGGGGGGITDNALIIAVSVAVVGLLLITAMIVGLLCYLKRRTKREPPAPSSPVTGTVVVQENPGYLAAGPGEEPPPYSGVFMTGESLAEGTDARDYENLEVNDEKKFPLY